MRVSIPPLSFAVVPKADCQSAFSGNPVVWDSAMPAIAVAFIDGSAGRHLACQLFEHETRSRRLPDHRCVELVGAKAAGDDLDALIEIFRRRDIETLKYCLGEAVGAAALGDSDRLAVQPLDGLIRRFEIRSVVAHQEHVALVVTDAEHGDYPQ